MSPCRAILVCVITGVVALPLSPGVAVAGMPSLTLDEVPRQRVESISVFLVGFLLCAVAVRFLWNGLRTDFTWLPRLTYLTALGLTSLWALAFVLVLTMISGARELLTPGAWDKDGLTYRLKTGATGRVPAGWDTQTRVRKLDALKTALWNYAAGHGGTFPADRRAAGIAADCWESPDVSRMRYLYVGGREPNERPALLAYEPELYGTDRYALFTDGDIKLLSRDQLAAAEAGR